LFGSFLLEEKKPDPEIRNKKNKKPLPSAEKKSVFRVHDILVWIRIRGSMPLTNGSGFGSGSCIRIRILTVDPDLAIFVFTLGLFKMPTKN
jgi:hypothetical protein